MSLFTNYSPNELIKIDENTDTLETLLTDIKGTDATGVSPNAGATGLKGWLSSIFNALVTAGVKLAASTALIGKVGIDQTTSGTTNGVSLVGATVAIPVDIQYNQLTSAEALPVTLSGSNVADTTLQNATTANGNGTSATLAGIYGSLTVQVKGITSATVNFETSNDGGTTWLAIRGTNQKTGDIATTTTTDGIFGFSVAGVKLFRARISNYISGTITILGTAIAVPGSANQDTTAQGLFDYNLLDYVVVAVRGNTLYATSVARNMLYKSTDNGVTWSVGLWSVPDSATVNVAHIMSNNTLIVFTSAGKIYRSTDGNTFTLVQSNISPPLNSNGVSSLGSVVCFGEYSGANYGTPVRIFTSIDNGATWNVTLDLGVNTAGGLSHLHSCQYIPMLGAFIATTGDSVMNWYKSVDGVTWTTWLKSTDQKRRTLSIVSVKQGEIIYCGDGSLGNSGAFKTHYNLATSTLNESETIMLINTATSYGLAAGHDVLMMPTMAGQQDKTANVYVSLDNGTGWVIDYKLKMKPTASYPGFTDVIGPDYKGNYYLRAEDSLELPSQATIKASPKTDKVKTIISESGTRISGINKNVITKTLTITDAQVGADNYINCYAKAGYIETVLNIICNIPAVTGATTGTHELEILYGSGNLNPGRLLKVSAAYNVGIGISSTKIYAGTEDATTSFAAVKQLINSKSLMSSNTTTFKLNYVNKTDVARSGDVEILMFVLEEEINTNS